MAQEHGRQAELKRTEFVTVGPGAFSGLDPLWKPAELAEAIIVNQWPEREEQETLHRQFPDEPRPAVYYIGERRLAVVVHRSNPLQSIKMTALHDLLAEPSPADPGAEPVEWPPLPAAALTWHDLGWRNVPVRPITEGPGSWSRELLKFRCLKRMEWSLGYKRWGNRPFRKDLVECMDAAEVIERVRRDASAIGFLQYTGTEDLDGVKLLAVEDDFPPDWPVDFAAPGPVPPIGDDGRVDFFAPADRFMEQARGPVAMELGAVLQPGYPLTEPLMLFIRPGAKESVKAFADYCVSEAGASLAQQHGLITPRMQLQAQAEQRLAAMQEGKGQQIGMTGDGDDRGLMLDLAAEYTRARAVVRMDYSAASPAQAVTAFNAGKELLLSRGMVDDSQLGRSARTRWESLRPVETERGAVVAEAGRGQRIVIGGMGVALVVNPLNPVDELTIDQIRLILEGEARTWADMGAPKENAAAIRCGVPDAREMAADILRKTVTPRRFGPGVVKYKDAASAVSAVAMEPGALAFVPAAALPPETARVGIKVLTVIAPSQRSAVAPTPQTIIDATYPLCRRLHLYVHPQATDTARDFARFVIEDAAIAEVFRRHGFISHCEAAQPASTDTPPAAAKSRKPRRR